MESAKTLLRFDFDADAYARRAPQPMKLSQDVRDLLAKIIDEHNSKNGSLSQGRLHQIYSCFCNTPLRKLPEEFSTRSRVRKLARVLTYSKGENGRIVDMPELCYALQLVESHFSIGALRGVCSALRQAPDALHKQMLKAFVKKYQTDPEMLSSRMKLLNILRRLGLPDYTHGHRYFGAVAGAHKSISRPRDKSTVADIVEFAAGEHKDDLTNREILSELIEQLGSDASEQLRQPIQSYALQKWKEPRIAGENWQGISGEAQQIFTRWIVEKDFHFFFDVVAKTVNDPDNDPEFKARKAFWSAYFEYISFCRPVLREGTENLFRHNQQDFQYYRDRCLPTLIGGAENQHAFIIEIRGHIFVEFSTAPMCYVYDGPNCPFRLDASRYNMSELRNLGSATQYIVRANLENLSWQSKFASLIARKLGIKRWNTSFL